MDNAYCGKPGIEVPRTESVASGIPQTLVNRQLLELSSFLPTTMVMDGGRTVGFWLAMAQIIKREQGNSILCVGYCLTEGLNVLEALRFNAFPAEAIICLG